MRLCAAAYPRVAERVPDAHMVLVCGPRIDPASLRPPAGVEVRGYVPRLYEHFAACDLAVVQAGGTTTLELTALRRPSLYFPLEGHLEHHLVVAKRLARHHAGQRLDYSHTAPEQLALAITDQLGLQPSWPAIPSDGAQRAAARLNRLVARDAASEGHAAKHHDETT